MRSRMLRVYLDRRCLLRSFSILLQPKSPVAIPAGVTDILLELIYSVISGVSHRALLHPGMSSLQLDASSFSQRDRIFQR